MIIASAPGKIILFGEHAVVYDKVGIACTVSKRCKVLVSPFQKDGIFIKAKDLKLSSFLERQKIFQNYFFLRNLIKKGELSKLKEISKKIN